ncbi:MAG: AI-2E family transporter [Pirellulales bacterium]
MRENGENKARSPHWITPVMLTIAVAALYFAKVILLPLALAVLLSFVLSPLVVRLERLRIGRLASVILVAAVTITAIAGVGWLATNQIFELSKDLPAYKNNLIAKIRSVRATTSGTFEEAQEAIQDIGEELSKGNDKPSEKSNAKIEGLFFPWLNTESAVKVVEMPPSPLSQLQTWLGPLVAPLSTSGLVFVLVIFILIKREDLRNRMIHLLGTSRLHATTQAIDDATRRLSRYLQMQLLINVIYGTVVAIGLAVVGVPNAMLWGVFGTSLRFLPYVGPWIAAAMPITLSLAVSHGWMMPIEVIALFVVMELIVNNVLEPWLYSSTSGVSSFGVIVAAMFWTWLWGPVGLVLAMPLTVCLVVVGKYVPQLSFVAVLFGDRSTLEPHEQLYQSLLSSHEFEATQLAEQYLESESLSKFYEEVLIPALHLAERDRHADLLNERQTSAVAQSVRDLVDDLTPAPRAEEGEKAKGRVRVLCAPARDWADEVVAMILDQLLRDEGLSVELSSCRLSTSEIVHHALEDRFDIVVVAILPPLGSRAAKYVCKGLRVRQSSQHIVAALMDGASMEKTQQMLKQSGANDVATNLSDTLAAVRRAANLRAAATLPAMS